MLEPEKLPGLQLPQIEAAALDESKVLENDKKQLGILQIPDSWEQGAAGNLGAGAAGNKEQLGILQILDRKGEEIATELDR